MSTQYIHYPSTGAGVTSLNSLTGAITLAAGSGISLTPAGNTITIAATSGVSYPLLAPNGSAAAPSYSFSAEATLGMYRVGSTNLGLSAATLTGAGSTDFTINRDANLGNLTLAGGTTAGTSIQIYASGSSAPNTIVFNTNGVQRGSISQSGILGWGGVITGSNLSGTNTGDQTITLTGEATGTGPAGIVTTLTNSAVIGKVLTGYTSGAGTVAATDTILQAVQKLNGNVALALPLAGGTVSGNITFSSSGKGLVGTATNDSADAGNVGELLLQSRAPASATAMTTNTTLNVTASALSLTAGDWDVQAMIGYTPTGTTSVTLLQAGISTTSATLPSGTTVNVPTSNQVRTVVSMPASVIGNDTSLIIPPIRVSVSTTTNIFLVANASFTVSTLTVYGSIYARRVR